MEENIGNALSPYAVSKRTNELYANVFAQNYNMQIIGLRYFNIFGPRQNPKGEYAAAIPLFMDALLKDQSPFINGDGEQSRDFTFVENAVQANIKAMFTTKQNALSRVYNIALGEKTSIIELFNILKDLAGASVNANHRADRAGDIRDSLADISKAKDLLGYNPQVKIKDGLKITLDWFSKHFGYKTLSKYLFPSKKLDKPVDLSVLLCDVHSHFIPAVDDGSKSVENSVEMIRHFYNQGYKKVITTPHIMGDFFRNSPETIMPGLEKVRQQLKTEGIPIQMDAAAEYYIDYEFEQKVAQGNLLTFGDNYVLVEISYVNQPDNMNRVLFALQTSGYKPVLAHPERYPFWFDKPDEFEKLVNKGILLQMNINSLTGYYSPETKKVAEMLIDKQWVSFLGSDCHHLGHIDLLKQVVYLPYLKKLVESGRLLNHTL